MIGTPNQRKLSSQFFPFDVILISYSSTGALDAAKHFDKDLKAACLWWLETTVVLHKHKDRQCSRW